MKYLHPTEKKGGKAYRFVRNAVEEFYAVWYHGNRRGAEARLDSVHITANKNTVPGETRSPFVTSGVRLGTPAVTTRGMGEAEMKVIADCIADCIWHYDEKKDDISARVLALTRAFPLYQ